MTTDTDIVIVGGGIAGVSAAARLAGAARVVVLEAEGALGTHASGRSAALFVPRYGKPVVKALSHASAGDYHAAAPAVLAPRGLMVIARPGDEAAFATDAAELDLAPLSPEAARALVPILRRDALAQAGLTRAAWDIDTDRVMQGHARAARAAGAEVRTGAAVTAIAREGTAWAVTTAAGRVRAPVLIDAAGAWADAVAEMAGVAPLGLVARRRSMARLPAPGGHDVTNWPMVIGAGERWYARPDAGALIVSPADEDAVAPHDAWADDMVLAEGLARFEEAVTTPVTRVLASWAGLRTFTPDRVPAIGFAPGAPGFFWLAGQGGYGFQTAPAASRLAADLVLGRAPALDAATVAALAPGRFA